jgi:hypothetical protein
MAPAERRYEDGKGCDDRQQQRERRSGDHRSEEQRGDEARANADCQKVHHVSLSRC